MGECSYGFEFCRTPTGVQVVKASIACRMLLNCYYHQLISKTVMRSNERIFFLSLQESRKRVFLENKKLCSLETRTMGVCFDSCLVSSPTYMQTRKSKRNRIQEEIVIIKSLKQASTLNFKVIFDAYAV